MFRDRIDAGQRLADTLKKYKDNKNTVVIAIPRGGIIIGYIISKELNLPLDVVLTKKLGHPNNPEYAIGAISLKKIVVHDNRGVGQEYIDDKTNEIQNLLKKRYQMYYGEKQPLNIRKKTVILVDDGIATGRTLISSIELLQQEEPEEIIVAIPVGPKETIRELSGMADKVICLETHDPFYAIGLYYEDFSQVQDSEVQEILKKSKTPSVAS